MIDINVLDPEDAELLQASYDEINQIGSAEVVADEKEWDRIFRQTVNSMSLPSQGNFSFQNLFKLTQPNGCFYIALCVIDFGYTTGRTINPGHYYKFQIIGIANLRVDMGKTMLRPETKLDKLVGRFFDHDIDLPGAERFNNKFYLVSDRKDEVEKVFDKRFTEAISRHANILLSTVANVIYIHFPVQITGGQSATVADIFSNCSFLEG